MSKRQRYYCKLCPDVEMWLTLRELMHALEDDLMPCGHDWMKRDWKRSAWELIEAREAWEQEQDVH